MEFALPGSDGFYFWWRGSFWEGDEMSKELPYFRFTAFEWLNDDISLEDYQTKGVFIDVCAYYWFKDCSITKAMLEKRFSTVMPVIELLFESGIIKFRNGDDFIEISFLNKQFDELSELRKQRQSAGSKGGKQRASKAKAKLKQNPSYKDKDKDKDKEKDKNIVPPTFEMVKAYCDIRNNGIDPQYFIDKNTAVGWTYGKNKTKIVDWQAHIRTWEKNKKDWEQEKNPTPVIPHFSSGPYK